MKKERGDERTCLIVNIRYVHAVGYIILEIVLQYAANDIERNVTTAFN